ncbi:acyl carrier protein [Lentzea flava]|uniref:Carrier domain-containing protein n=1 Tax=Lentzea flava TaxID=103732 RepID=A0ABQ2VGH1_9PSEU|nr:acyl carrier protein [Lentzea flava]MCP2205193.1 Phosphopantetheine attachment site [Lentzea flava]GGU84541.1 hypothetical protein GCM10010178_88540 [Lentzea flava]
MLTTTEIKQRIIEAVVDILAGAGEVVTGVSGSDELVALGVSSMLYARMVMKLEAEFGVEVFDSGEQPAHIRTIDDLADTFSRAMV